MLEVFINVILLRKPVIKKRIEYHDALNGKLKKTKKKHQDQKVQGKLSCACATEALTYKEPYSL